MLQNLFKIQWVLAAVVTLCLAVSLPVQADDDVIATDVAEGRIDAIETNDDEKTTITICAEDTFVESCTTIAAFPLGFVERELVDFFDNDDFVLDVGDCVAVAYAIDVRLGKSDSADAINVALRLTKYCPGGAEEAPEASCSLPEDGCGDVPTDCYCDAEGLVFRDDDLDPVFGSEKNKNNTKQHKNNNKPPGNKN